MKISVFKDINTPDNPITMDVTKTFERIKNGHSREKIEAIRACEDGEMRNTLKGKLPCVVYQGVFSKRGNSFCTEQSKLIILDFDYVADVTLAKMKYTKLPYALAVWTSPSGKGVKVLVKVATTDHTGHFLALQNEFPEIDKSGKDIARICFESFDPDIYINSSCTEYKAIYKAPEVKKVDKKSDDYVFECLRTWLQSKGQNFVDGNRNNYVFKLATACNRVGIPEGIAEFNISSCITGGDFQTEAVRIVRGAYRRYSTDFAKFEFTDNNVVNRVSKENENETVFLADDTTGDIIMLDSVIDELLNISVNGITKGDTTYFPKIDECFRWMRGQFTLLHGLGNFGKTSILTQLELIKSIHDDTKWIHFSPEQMPPEIYFRDIIQAFYGKSMDNKHLNYITRDEIDYVKQFINEHFILVYPKKKSPTPDYILEMFFEGIIKYNVSGTVIDPWNQMSHNWGEFSRPDLYLEKYLTKFKLFTKQNNIYSVLCTHPANPPRPERDKPMPAPDTWNIKGGGVWNDIMDNILCYHRPYHHIDRSRTDCQFISQKIRFQQMNGIPGVVDMDFNRATCRFYIDGVSPFDLIKDKLWTS